MYYVGGQTSPDWNVTEHETIGLTHPFFHDGRARGHTLIRNHLGTGHDMWGWEFWRDTRGAYGSVIVNGQVTCHPAPVSMEWRPDRQVCRYRIGDVTIYETKFIALNDVACSIISSNKPVTLQFEGSSFVLDDSIPVFDDDRRNVAFSQKREATGEFIESDNAIHIIEKGTMMGKADWGEPAVEAPMMYSGLSVVLSASRSLATTQHIHRDDKGRQCYDFQIPCDSSGTVITYSIADQYEEAIATSKKVLHDPWKALHDKTDWYNRLLNTEIPRFRCSDRLAVKTYYYLWAIYFMYFTDAGDGWERYPHTQTAVNNFLGLHLWDSYVYTRMGAWTTDQKRWGQGNALAWSSLVSERSGQGSMPDNFGVAWYSPAYFRIEGHVEGAWQQYEHSGDREFLADVYEMYRKLLFNTLSSGGSGMLGHSLCAVSCLQKMAVELGKAEDVAHWNQEHARLRKAMNQGWEMDTPDFFGSTRRWKDNWELAVMLAPDFPDSWARRLVNTWIVNSERGFLSPLGIRVRSHDSVENGMFAVSTISAWQAIEGMFRHRCDEAAVFLTLLHLHGMVRDFGYPIAPECWNPRYEPWFDLHYNWDGAMALLMLERLAGVHVSLPEQSLIIEDHLPKEWSFVEVQVPLRHGGNTCWTKVRIERDGTPDAATKRVKVRGCPLERVIIRPWREGRQVIASVPDAPSAGILDFKFARRADVDIKIGLGPVLDATPLRPWLTPRRRVFIDSLRIEIENLDSGSDIHYTLDGTEPVISSPVSAGPITLTRSSALKLRAFSPHRTPSEIQTVTFTKLEPLQPILETNVSHGLQFRIFRGRWDRMPDFDRLIAARTGIADRVSLSPAADIDKDYAIVFDGFLRIEHDGLYSLQTESHNTSAVYVDGKLITSIELWSDSIDPWDRSGWVALRAGMHRLRVIGIHANGRQSLAVSMRNENDEYSKLTTKQVFYATADNE